MGRLFSLDPDNGCVWSKENVEMWAKNNDVNIEYSLDDDCLGGTIMNVCKTIYFESDEDRLLFQLATV